MACKRCKSERLVSVCGKTSDQCSLVERETGKGRYGYVYGGIGLGNESEDYIEFTYCLNCGQMQGRFPVSKTAVSKAFKDCEYSQHVMMDVALNLFNSELS